MRGTPKQPHHHYMFASGYLAMTIAFIFLSCSQKQEEQKASLLSDFWKKEIARLNKEKPTVTKISTVNGKTDTIRTDSINWENELQIFTKNDYGAFDGNNYKIKEEYRSHSSLGGGVFLLHNIHHYIALDTNTRIQKVSIDVFQKVDEPQKMKTAIDSTIELIIKQKQQLYSTYKRLKYSTTQGYTIEGSQDVKFLNGINYKVQVKFER